ncbi:transcriptional regulator [Echinicola strongylocentroti]|uniref:Transcriptional regulator n=1 Tax=Echinicola strongylocentroti TaxID=1795355 RepID=A0A2Z4IDR4_9BACT|nr:GntR family transcriptional regulator [Echinicola strongylocentroti]AWW28867.1 transcriptional regulator [Echinicola strongylocentroti]
MNDTSFIRISPNSRVPKYRQIVNSITEDVNGGKLEIGARIPSINELSERHYVSRDTVEKAYKILKEKGILKSKKSIGYYIANTMEEGGKKVLLLINKFSDYKLKIYKAFLAALDQDFKVDFYVYHCDDQLFVNKLNESIGQYYLFVVMPHFKNENDLHVSINDKVLNVLKKIAPNKLIVMDNKLEELAGPVPAIYQDFKMDIYYALIEANLYIQKYKKLILIFPANSLYPHPQEIKIGFRKFCVENDVDFEIIDSSGEVCDVQKGDAYIVIQENDLVGIISQIKEMGVELGKDIGVISYNDTPLKQFLGITVFTTDFESMGRIAAGFIKSNKKEQLKNEFIFINRGSI